MSSRWSSGELVLFAKIAKEVFDYRRNASQDLLHSLQKFQDVADQLEDLADVLQKSGWPGYDNAPKLREDLEEAKGFFHRSASPSSATARSASRLFDARRLGIGNDRSNLQSIDDKFTDHLEKLSAFKQHIVLTCSLRNLELIQRLQAHSPVTATNLKELRPPSDDREDTTTSIARPDTRPISSEFEVDNATVISNAFSAINLASNLKKSSPLTSIDRETRRAQPELEAAPALGPIPNTLTPATEQDVIDEFIDEMVSLSEELQLHSQNPSLPQSPQQLAKITSAAVRLCDDLQPQHYRRTSSSSFNLAGAESSIKSFRESIFSTLSKHTDETSIMEWSPIQPDQTETSLKFADKATSPMNERSLLAVAVEPPPKELQRERSSAFVSQSGNFVMDIGPPAKQPLAFTVWLFETSIIGVAPIECTLDFADANESTSLCSITAIAVNQRRKSPSSRSDLSSMALTPQAHLDLPEHDTDEDTRRHREHRRIFHHRFPSGRRPFPHVLHPDVEGPNKDNDPPYTITFTVPQHLEEEGVPSPPSRSTKLKYIFSNKEDRDILQSLIFGKALLFSAGINKVVTTAPTKIRSDDQQAVRLWLSKDGKTKSITVYFRDNKTRQKLYKEYLVRGLQSDAQKLKPDAPVQVLVVEALPVPAAAAVTADTRTRSSTASAQTLSSAGPAEPAASTSKPSTCCLYFSRDRARANFLRFFT